MDGEVDAVRVWGGAMTHGQVAAAMLGSWAMPVSSPDDKVDTVEAVAHPLLLGCWHLSEFEGEVFRDSGPDARHGAFTAPPAAGAGPDWIVSQAPAFLSPPFSSKAAGTGVAGEAVAGAGTGMTMMLTILPVFRAPAGDDGSVRQAAGAAARGAAGAVEVASLPSAGDLHLCEPGVFERLQLKQQRVPGASRGGGSWSTKLFGGGQDGGRSASAMKEEFRRSCQPVAIGDAVAPVGPHIISGAGLSSRYSVGTSASGCRDVTSSSRAESRPWSRAGAWLVYSAPSGEEKGVGQGVVGDGEKVEEGEEGVVCTSFSLETTSGAAGVASRHFVEVATWRAAGMSRQSEAAPAPAAAAAGSEALALRAACKRWRYLAGAAVPAPLPTPGDRPTAPLVSALLPLLPPPSGRGRGVTEIKHSADVESTNGARASV